MPSDFAITRGLPVPVLIILTSLPGLAGDWSPKLAAQYLDSRQKEWFAWPPAKRSGGPCISCHTGATYLLARPTLRRVLGEAEPTPYETGLVDGLRARVGSGLEDALKTGKEPVASQSVGVEAIFAALFLPQEKPAAQQAWDRLWSMQIHEGAAKGSWPWFDFNTDPYETSDSGIPDAAGDQRPCRGTHRVSSDSGAGAAPAQSPADVVGSSEAARRHSGRETIHHRRNAEKTAARWFVDDRGSRTVEGPPGGATRRGRERIRHRGRCLRPATGGCPALESQVEEGAGLAARQPAS